MTLIGKKIAIKGADFTDIAISGIEKYTLNSIAITTNPTKQIYEVGETFDPTGMVVTASLTGNITGTVITKDVSDYTYTPTSAFVETGTKTVTISYTLDDVTKTTTIGVQVNPETVKYNFTASCTNGVISPASGQISEGGSQEFTVTPSQGYKMPSQVTCTGGTATILGNKVTVSSVTGEVTLSVACEALVSYTISGSITNGELTGATTILEASGATVTINPISGYEYPTEVNVSGATFSYLAASGVVTLNNPTSDVIITATCPKAENWMSNILSSDSTAHTTWQGLPTADIKYPTTLKYTASWASLVEGKTITKIASQNPTTSGLQIDFYTADATDNNVITNLGNKITTVNLNTTSGIEEYTLQTPVTLSSGKTLVLYVSGAFPAKYQASWQELDKIDFQFNSTPTENLTLSQTINWSAFDFYMESEEE